MTTSRSLILLLTLCTLFLGSNHWKLLKTQVDDNLKLTSLFAKESKFLETNTKLINPSTILQKEVSYDQANDIFHFKITDPKNKHFEVPADVFSNHQVKTGDVFSNGFVVRDPKNPLNFEIMSKKNKTVFSFKAENLTYSDLYIEYSYSLTTDAIFGYGERVHNFKLDAGIYTIWPNDTGTPIDDGKGGKNLYGTHPFILNRALDGTFIGLLFVNTNAQDLIISNPTKNGTVNLVQKSIGGEINYYIFRGNTPLEVISKYQLKIGFPQLPPFWSLGWHQCRWGYNNTTVLDTIVQTYRNKSLPLDTIWSDIDYMNKYADFTVDPVKFANLSNTVDSWHKDNLHYVPIVDLGIALTNSSYYIQLGNNLSTFIMSNYSKKPLINTVWPGDCNFPDFTNPNASTFWSIGLNNLSQLTHCDGFWLDMNEPGLFVKGETNSTVDPSKNMYSYLPYYPGGGNIDLEGHSASLNALMYGTGDKTFGTMYNFKPYNPFYQNKITANYISQSNQRPFVLSRSSMFGQGRYSFHWLGDNYSTLESMKYSIPGILNFQMFGFNLVGADICGFGGNTNDQLCSRWMDLGAFYPFSRNHNAWDSIAQEPWALGNLTLASSYNALRMRYSLLRYMYTQMFLSSLSGGVVFQPIFFQFPDDDEAYQNNDEQFMLGPALLLSPILQLNENNITAYFPNANWNEFPSGKNLTNFNTTKDAGGNYFNLTGKFNALNIHQKGGSILPYQNATNITRTAQLFNIKTSLYINPDQNLSAVGSVVFDDGISQDTIVNRKYAFTAINLNNNTMSFNSTDYSAYNNTDILIDKLVFFRGIQYSNYKNVVVLDTLGNKVAINTSYDTSANIFSISFVHDLRIPQLKAVNFS